MATVELLHVSKEYTDQLAVSDFSIYIEDGEFVALVGPSGCGKTTTLRMIAGLTEASSGSIYIGEKPMEAVQAKDRNLSMVFQNFALYPHMTARKNISFGLMIQKKDKKTIDEKVEKVAEMLNISHLLHRKPFELSGGEQQRVALGRALIKDPDVFLFDEPLSNLDAKMRYDMRHEIIKLHERTRGTFIYVTHDQVEAMTMADRIVVMNKGKIMQVDTPLGLYKRPKNIFVATFIGTPPINILPMTIVEKHNRLSIVHPAGYLELSMKTSFQLKKFVDTEVLVGIRPDQIVAFTEKDVFDGTSGFEVTCRYTEQMGGHQIVHGNLIGDETDENPFNIQAETDRSFLPGETIWAYLMEEHLLFFDTDTAENILE